MGKIKEKQVWNFNSIKDDKSSFILINKLDFENEIAHISIFNVCDGEESFDIGHIPINIENLIDSLTNEIDIDDLEYKFYLEGYKEWEKSEGGVWNISLKEVINTIIKTMKSD